MAEQSLLERSVEKKFEDKSETDIQQIVSELTFEDGELKYKTISEDKWKSMATVDVLLSTPIDEIIKSKNLIINQTEKEQILNLKFGLDSVWDEQKEMFIISRESDEDNHLKNLKVNIRSEIADDIIVDEVHNDEGEFVAQHIESQIDREIHELWDVNMYVRDPWSKDSVVHIEVENKPSFVDKFSGKIDEVYTEYSDPRKTYYANFSSASGWLKGVTKNLITVILISVTIWIISIISSSFGSAYELTALTFMYLLGLMVIIEMGAFIARIFRGLFALKRAMDQETPETEEFFKTSEVDSQEKSKASERKGRNH